MAVRRYWRGEAGQGARSIAMQCALSSVSAESYDLGDRANVEIGTALGRILQPNEICNGYTTVTLLDVGY
jgi:hypothetical protein